MERNRFLALSLLFLAVPIIQVMFDAALPASMAENASADYIVFYRPVAENLVAGDGLTLQGEPATFWGPGYPVILAGSFMVGDAVSVSHDDAVEILRLAVLGATAVVLLLLFERFFDPRTAWVSIGLWALFPVNLYLGKQPNADLPFRLVLYLALLCLVVGLQRRQAIPVVAAGAMLGVTTLIRPAALLLVVLVALLLAWRSRSGDRRLLTYAGLVLVGSVAVLAPWQVYLTHHTDGFAVVSTNGTAAIVDGLTIGTDADEVAVGGFTDASRAVMEDATSARPELGSYGGIVSFLADQATSEPVGLIQLGAIKAVRSWWATESGTGPSLLLLLQMPMLALTSIGLVSGLRARRFSRTCLMVTVAVPLYFWFVTIAVLPLLRYMVPSQGLTVPFVVLGLSACWRFAFSARSDLGREERVYEEVTSS